MRYIPSTINLQSNKTVWVVDDYYKDPHFVRDFALKQKFSANPEKINSLCLVQRNLLKT